MDKIVDKLNERANKLDEMADSTSLALAEMRLQFETLAVMQKEERAETQRMHQEETERVRKHYGKIIIGLILTLCLFIGGVFGAILYLFTNYDFAVQTYQDVYSDNDGTATIYDGIHVGGD